jgi:hypothetical protein
MENKSDYSRLLAPVTNFTKITGFKVAQTILKAQWCLDTLSPSLRADGVSLRRVSIGRLLSSGGIARCH